MEILNETTSQNEKNNRNGYKTSENSLSRKDDPKNIEKAHKRMKKNTPGDRIISEGQGSGSRTGKFRIFGSIYELWDTLTFSWMRPLMVIGTSR